MDRGVGKVEDFGAKVEHPDRKGESFTKKVELRFILEHGVLKVERFLRKVEYPGRKVERSMRKVEHSDRKVEPSKEKQIPHRKPEASHKGDAFFSLKLLN